MIPTIKEQIYQQYLKAYKKGVFNYIKEDINTVNGETKSLGIFFRRYKSSQARRSRRYFYA